MKSPTFGLLTLPLNLMFWVLTGCFGHSQVNGQAVGIDWQRDLSRAFEDAQAGDKLVLIHFTASWSRKSKELQTFVFKDPRVARAMDRNVIPVSIDVDQFPQLSQEYGVEEVPYDLVLTAGGRVVVRRPSPTSSDHYATMIERLDRTINLIKEQGLAAVDSNVDGLNEWAATQQALRPQRDFTPVAPTQPPPAPSRASAELLRLSHTTTQQNSLKPIGSPLKPLSFIPDQAERELAITRPDFQLEPLAQPATPPGGLRIINENFFAEGAGEPTTIQASASTENVIQPASLTSTIEPAPKEEGPAEMPAQSLDSSLDSSLDLSLDSSLDSESIRAGQELKDFPESKSELSELSELSESAESNSLSQDHSQDSRAGQIALQGHCPVTLVKERRWVKGNPKTSCLHRDRLFCFQGPAELKEFQQAPDAFSPLMSGCDPVVYHQTGKWVEGKEEHGAFLGNPPHFRVVLFASRESRQEFGSDPRKYIEIIRTAMEQLPGGGKSGR